VSVLYIIATPIGNLEDISLRALRLLGQVSLSAAEDTRTTRHLLDSYKIKNRLTSYHEHNKKTKLDHILEQLKSGDVALVSDAGMPGLSDTGYELISAAIEQNIPVVPVPGPSALITAVVISGLPANQFMYLGFLPRRKVERIKLFKSLVNEPRTLVTFESPHRILQSLRDALESLGNRRLAVCRELTKIYEEVFRGTISQALSHFSTPLGEFTLVISGKEDRPPEVNANIENELLDLFRNGVKAREAAAALSAKSGIPRNQLYQTWLKITKGE
jgi:16S rRNA (cytidine1402-2'-O)-methyltransferase